MNCCSYFQQLGNSRCRSISLLFLYFPHNAVERSLICDYCQVIFFNDSSVKQEELIMAELTFSFDLHI